MTSQSNVKASIFAECRGRSIFMVSGSSCAPAFRPDSSIQCGALHLRLLHARALLVRSGGELHVETAVSLNINLILAAPTHANGLHALGEVAT